MNVRRIFWEEYNRLHYDHGVSHDRAIVLALDAVQDAANRENGN